MLMIANDRDGDSDGILRVLDDGTPDDSIAHFRRHSTVEVFGR